MMNGSKSLADEGPRLPEDVVEQYAGITKRESLEPVCLASATRQDTLA